LLQDLLQQRQGAHLLLINLKPVSSKTTEACNARLTAKSQILDENVLLLNASEAEVFGGFMHSVMLWVSKQLICQA